MNVHVVCLEVTVLPSKKKSCRIADFGKPTAELKNAGVAANPRRATYVASVARGAGEEEELGRGHAPNVRRAIPPTLGPERALRRAPAAESGGCRASPSSSYPPSQLQQAPRPPVSPARAAIDYRDAPSPSPFAIRRPADTSQWPPALRLMDDPVFKAAAEAPDPSPRSWNPPPPSLKSQPRKRKLTSDAEHTLFRPGYVPLDPEETSRGARNILAAVNARAAAAAASGGGEGSLGEGRGADRKRGGSLVRRSPLTRSPVRARGCAR